MNFRILRLFSSNVLNSNLSKVSLAATIPPLPKKEGQLDPTKHRKKKKVITKEWFIPQTVNIGIIGADERAGHSAAVYLKQHPLVQKLYLHGGENIPHMVEDLRNIDTSTSVVGFNTEDELPNALRALHIVILMDFDHKDSDVCTKFRKSAHRVKYLAKQCIKYAPRAVILICVEPVSCTVPLTQLVFKESPFYHPSRIVGCISPLQARVNSVAARYLDLSPDYVHVPLVGGSDVDTLVPLLSSITPDPLLDGSMKNKLFNMLINDTSISDCFESKKTLFSEGYAIAQLAVVVAKGLCGHIDALAPSYVRTNFLNMLSYFITTVRFGFGGIVQNYGIPKMNRFELEKFEKAILILRSREQMAKDYIINCNASVEACCCG